MSFPCGAHQATALLTAIAAFFHCYFFPLQFFLPLQFLLPPLLSTAAAIWRTGGQDVIPLRSTSGHCATYCDFSLLSLLLVSTAILVSAAILAAAATFYHRCYLAYRRPRCHSPAGAHQATALLTAFSAYFHCYLFPLQFLLPLHFLLPSLLSTAAAT